MNITVVNNLPKDEWRQFVEKHPAGSIFHTPEMFQVFSQTKGFRPELWAATREGRILALLLPVQITLMNGLLFRNGVASSNVNRIKVYGAVFTEKMRGCSLIGSKVVSVTIRGSNPFSSTNQKKFLGSRFEVGGKDSMCCGNAVLQSEERIAHGPERIHPSSRLVQDYGGQVAHSVRSFKGREKNQDERFEVGD